MISAGSMIIWILSVDKIYRTAQICFVILGFVYLACVFCEIFMRVTQSVIARKINLAVSGGMLASDSVMFIIEKAFRMNTNNFVVSIPVIAILVAIVFMNYQYYRYAKMKEERMRE